MSSTQANLSNLKEKLEQLFPGKWSQGASGQRSVLTGIAELDNGVARGVARRRITEWVGPLSSGKSTLLRSVIAHWCASGMNVAYVDKLGRLRASDWAFVERGNSGVSLSNMMVNQVLAPARCAGTTSCIGHAGLGSTHTDAGLSCKCCTSAVKAPGRFVVARNFKGSKHEQDALWATEQLIRSGAFDVVVLDAAGNLSLASRIYARLQRALERSKTALLIVKDEDVEGNLSAWGCHAKLGFGWGLPIECESGLSGPVSILPAVHCSVWRDGLSQKIEVNIRSHVSNRLFTHPQVPDRRTSKT